MFSIYKTIISLVLLITTVGSLPGCTRMLYDKKQFSEDVSHVMVSEDKKTLAVIGREHHYLFELPTTLATALLSPLHDSIEAKLGPFHVEPDGVIHGNCTLYIARNATEDIRNAAFSAGFKDTGYGTVKFEVELKGTIYLAGDIRIPETVEKLNEIYNVPVIIEHSGGRKLMNYALTPIAVAGVGTGVVLMIGGVALATPVAVVYVYSSLIYKSFKSGSQQN